MKTPPPDKPFDPDDPNFDPWADDPNAPKEPGLTDDPEIPWDEPGEEQDEVEDPTPTPLRVNPTGPVRGPVALLDSELRGEIEFEILFQQTKAELLKPPPAPSLDDGRRNLLLLVATAGLFVMSFASEGLQWIGTLLGVLFVHELGHYLAMRYFGYRDVKMFFIPFFGAAVTGRHETAAVWKRAVTYLAGPLPGLALGAALYFAFRPPVESWLFELVRMLLLLNAFNLLPIVPLDGGRVLDALFLSRRPWASTIFRAFAVAVLMALVVWVDTAVGKVVLGLIAVFTLLATPLTHRQARSRKVLANHFPRMPENLAAVPNDALRDLFGVTLALANGNYEPTRLAAVMRDLHGQAATRPASPRTAVVLLGVYLLGWLLTAVAIVPMARAELARDDEVRPLLLSFVAANKVEGREPEWSLCVDQWQTAAPAARNDALAELELVKLKSPAGVDYLPKLRQAVAK